MHQRPARPPSRRDSLASLALLVSLVFVVTPAAQAVNIAQDKIVNPNPENWTPNVLNGQINSIVQIGNQIYAGGQFTQVQAASGGTIYSRSNLFAFNATTGAIDTTFAPTFDDIIKALAVAPDGNLLVGGYFNAVNGDTTVKKLVKLNPTTGQRITAFSANANGQVWDIKVSGTRLFVGGRFTMIKNVARDRLAAVNTTTGAVDPNVSFSITEPHTSDSVPWVYSMDVSPDGSDLVIIGNFMKVNNQPRPQAALLDVSTTPASLANWQTDRYIPLCFSNAFDTYMRDVDFSPDGSYFVIVTTGGPNVGTLCDTAARWETNAQGTGAPAHLGRCDRRRHALGRRRHRLGRVRGRAPALDEQLVRERFRGTRCGRSARDRGPGSGQRPAVLLEPGPGTAGSASSPCSRRTPGCGWATTPTASPVSCAGRSRSSRWRVARRRLRPIPTRCRATSTTSRSDLGRSTSSRGAPSTDHRSGRCPTSARRAPIGAQPEDLRPAGGAVLGFEQRHLLRPRVRWHQRRAGSAGEPQRADGLPRPEPDGSVLRERGDLLHGHR